MWEDFEAELRQLLRDGPLDRLRFNKKVFGVLNGVNTLFKTFEYQCITDFTQSTNPAPLGVYLNDVLIPNTGISFHNLDAGAFGLVTPPVDGDDLTATYYVQFFTTEELQQFGTNATRWMSLGDDVTQVGSGLRPAILDYAMGDAYAALALRYTEKASETYQLEDMPDADRKATFKVYSDKSTALYASALKKRNDFYTRSGQNLQPLSGVVKGRVRSLP